MMPEKLLFEYAVVRVMPRVEREEFVNVGVVVYCVKQKFLKAIIRVDEMRLNTFCSSCDCQALKEHLLAFERICNGGRLSGPIGQLTIAERFRWLTATRSTIVQTSKVHPGFCDDAGDMLERLYLEMVQ